MALTIKSIQFKRGTKANLDAILVGSNKPSKGEPIWEEDTNKLKIGDGVKDYKDLPYLTGGGSDIDEIVLKGYYDKNTDVFYKDEQHYSLLPRLKSKIYLDVPTGIIYYLDTTYKQLYTHKADENTFGLVKLYTTFGLQTDGTMTQKSISELLPEVDKTEEEQINFKSLI